MVTFIVRRFHFAKKFTTTPILRSAKGAGEKIYF
jgi:hypothetical protein